MWCLVYLLLAVGRGCTCRPLVPDNLGTCVYLKSIGLFDLLKERGIEVDDRQVPLRKDPQAVLPLPHFSRPGEVEELASRTLEALNAGGRGAVNLRPLVSEAFAELALNAVEHAESSTGAFGLVQFYRYAQGERFICVVADGGIGVRRSLERNPNLRDRVPYDWVALELATRERVSGTGQSTRGIGLFGVAEDMRKAGRQLILHSGIGMLTINEEVELEARRATLFPGTLAFASIPT
jgi:anti-sigma regulatory factor (Ser/Thr protein kinase)